MPASWGDPYTQDGDPVIKGGPGLWQTAVKAVLTGPNNDVVIVAGTRTGTIIANMTTKRELPLPHLGAVSAAATDGSTLLLLVHDAQDSSAQLQALRVDPVAMTITQQTAIPHERSQADLTHVSVAGTTDGSIWVYVATSETGGMRGQLYRIGTEDHAAGSVSTPHDSGLHMTQLDTGLLYFYGGKAANSVSSFNPATSSWLPRNANLGAPAGSYVMGLNEA